MGGVLEKFPQLFYCTVYRFPYRSKIDSFFICDFFKCFVVEENLLNTYSMSSYEEMWKSFDLCLCLFKKISKKVADSLGYNYPDYDENVTKYLETQKRISNKYLYGNRY